MSESVLCRLADVRRQTRQSWSRQRLLRSRKGNTYTELDLLETVACKALITALGPSDGRDAWRQLRESYQLRLLVDRLDVVWSEADHEAALVTTDRGLVRVARDRGLIRVVSLSSEMRRVRGAFARYRDARESDEELRHSPGATASRTGDRRNG